MSASKTPSQIDHDACFRQEAREAFNDQLSGIACEEDKEELLVSIQSFSFHFIRDVSRRLPAESEAVQQGLYVLWHMFLSTAKALEKEDPFQEKLISLLLQTKEFDSLRRSLHPAETAATTTWESFGFADSSQALWEQLLTTGGIWHECNLAAFSAKALAVGICQDSLGLTALWCLREVLETDDERRAISSLPAAVVWIEHCRHKLLTFSATNKSYEEQSKAHLMAPGALAQRAGIDQHGFSLKRWLFWRRRLQELSHHVEFVVAKKAKMGFMNMVSCGRDLDYNVSGEARFAERLQAAMGQALAKSGKQSVSGDEIDINVDWVD